MAVGEEKELVTMKTLLPLLVVALAIPAATAAQTTYPPCSATVQDQCTETGHGMAMSHHKMSTKHKMKMKKHMAKPMAMSDKAETKDAMAPK